MTPVIWTAAALRDVARLHAFLAPKNREVVQRAIKAIRQGV
jgi:plasmid stabilization system protein ParE